MYLEHAEVGSKYCKSFRRQDMYDAQSGAAIVDYTQPQYSLQPTAAMAGSPLAIQQTLLPKNYPATSPGSGCAEIRRECSRACNLFPPGVPPPCCKPVRRAPARPGP